MSAEAEVRGIIKDDLKGKLAAEKAKLVDFAKRRAAIALEAELGEVDATEFRH